MHEKDNMQKQVVIKGPGCECPIEYGRMCVNRGLEECTSRDAKSRKPTQGQWKQVVGKQVVGDRGEGMVWESARAHGVSAPVDGQCDARAEGGSCGGQKEDGLRNFLRLTHPTQRVRRPAVLEELRAASTLGGGTVARVCQPLYIIIAGTRYLNFAELMEQFPRVSEYNPKKS